jgi:hypothetical protein
MATANSTGVRSRADHSPRPVLTVAGDSDPDMDEALRRATAAVTRFEAEREAARRAEIEAAWAEYADQPFAEYHEYVASAA